MSKIFANSEEKYVANYMLFADASHLFAFVDAEMTKKATKSEVVNMFKKGVAVDYAGKLYAPVACDASSDVAKLTLATVGSNAFVLVTITSDEDPA